eukprot:scaffold389_cov382-Prasinococcus_capsulatus_cf.AAC.10
MLSSSHTRKASTPVKSRLATAHTTVPAAATEKLCAPYCGQGRKQSYSHRTSGGIEQGWAVGEGGRVVLVTDCVENLGDGAYVGQHANCHSIVRPAGEGLFREGGGVDDHQCRRRHVRLAQKVAQHRWQEVVAPRQHREGHGIRQRPRQHGLALGRLLCLL